MNSDYEVQEIGIKFNDIMKAIQGVNENKAVMGILKPQLIRIGNGRTEEILFRIIEQI